MRIYSIKGATSKDYVTPQMFGAIGDGVTDDTLAFQKAIDSGKHVVVPLYKNEKYLITSTLSITKVRQKIIGDLGLAEWNYLENYPHGEIIFNGEGELFNVAGGFNTFDSLPLRNFKMDNTCTAIKFRKENSTNIDSEVVRCTFEKFRNGIHMTGRGLYVHECVFMSNYFDVYYELENIDNWVDDPDNSTLFVQNHPSSVGRSFRMVSNRHHATVTKYLYVVSTPYTGKDGEVIQQTLVGALITDNMADIGRAGFQFNCDVDALVFSNNVYYYVLADYFITCNKQIRNSVFSGNTIRGFVSPVDSSQNRCATYIFHLANIIDSVITGNVFENVKNMVINMFDTSDFTRNIVSNNVFKNYALESTTEYAKTAIKIGNASESVISDNIFHSDIESNGYAIQCKKSENTWTDIDIHGNMFTYGKQAVSPPSNVVRGNIQKSNVEENTEQE